MSITRIGGISTKAVSSPSEKEEGSSKETHGSSVAVNRGDSISPRTVTSPPAIEEGTGEESHGSSVAVNRGDSISPRAISSHSAKEEWVRKASQGSGSAVNRVDSISLRVVSSPPEKEEGSSKETNGSSVAVSRGDSISPRAVSSPSVIEEVARKKSHGSSVAANKVGSLSPRVISSHSANEEGTPKDTHESSDAVHRIGSISPRLNSSPAAKEERARKLSHGSSAIVNRARSKSPRVISSHSANEEGASKETHESSVAVHRIGSISPRLHSSPGAKEERARKLSHGSSAIVNRARSKSPRVISSHSANEEGALKVSHGSSDIVSQVFSIQDLLFRILQDVPISELTNIGLTCRHWEQVLQHPSFNRTRLALDFPFSRLPHNDPNAAYHRKVKILLSIRSPSCMPRRDDVRSMNVSEGFGKMEISERGMICGSSLAYQMRPRAPSARVIFDLILYSPAATALETHQDSAFTGDANGQVFAWQKNEEHPGWRKTHTIRTGVHQITALLKDDGDWLFAADTIGRIHLLSLSQEKSVSVDFAHANEVRSLQKLGDSLFSAGKDGAIYEWKIESEKLSKKAAISARGGVSVTRLHPFHGMLLAAREDGAIALYQKDQGGWALQELLKINSFPIRAFASHENLIFCGSEDGKIIVWEHERGSWRSFHLPQGEISNNDPVISLYYEKAENRLHCGRRSGSVVVYNFFSFN